MKRAGNLFEKIVSFENLLLAARKAQRGKRFKNEVLAFNRRLEENLLRLRDALRCGDYAPGAYRTFEIYEPKRRLISAAPYRDRVVHHALCNVIEPLFDRRLLDSCYANRTGKGTHRALDHFVRCARQRTWCLRADVEKYFPTMDHEILKESIRRVIKCRSTLWLIDLIIDNSNPQEPVLHHFAGDDLLTPCERRRGLPIGNLSSQLWANVYLMQVDHAMAHRFGGARYLRYVDDFALFGDDRAALADAQAMLAQMLAARRQRLHPSKSGIEPVRAGVNFLGFRVLPDRIRLRPENLKRARRRFRQLQRDFAEGAIQFSQVIDSLRSWSNHAAFGDTYRLREAIFNDLEFSRS